MMKLSTTELFYANMDLKRRFDCAEKSGWERAWTEDYDDRRRRYSAVAARRKNEECLESHGLLRKYHFFAVLKKKSGILVDFINLLCII